MDPHWSHSAIYPGHAPYDLVKPDGDPRMRYRDNHSDI